MNSIATNVVRIEAAALQSLAERLAGPMADAFERALSLLFHAPGRIVVTGLGKSGIIARKIAATLSSTGSPALFLHPVEALHGDIGVIMPGDVAIILSASGESDELLRLLPTFQRLGVPLISLTGDEICVAGSRLSTLAAAATVALDCSIAQEACNLGLAPTASTTVMLALGDALAVALSETRGFRIEDFAHLHPGGKLGRKLARVESLMHSGDNLPQVSPATEMPDVIYEMSRKKLGVTAVVEAAPANTGSVGAPRKLLGLISDGDLRRLLGHRGKDVLDLTAADAMTHTPQTILAGTFAATALAIMEEKKITSLCVVDDSQLLLGIVHLHDLWE